MIRVQSRCRRLIYAAPGFVTACRLAPTPTASAISPRRRRFSRNSNPSNSLRTGNLTGNFSGFGPSGRFSCPIDKINQWLVPKFPELRENQEFVIDFNELQPNSLRRAEQGIFCLEQGIFFDGSGNSYSLIGFMETTDEALERVPVVSTVGPGSHNHTDRTVWIRVRRKRRPGSL
jgi:hypothetical protein